MNLGEFGTKPNSELLQTRRVDHALTGHLGVEYEGEIANKPSINTHEHVGTLKICPSCLQYTQPWKNYQNIKLG